MIYLASSSPRRRALLKEAGIAYKLLRPDYDEKPIRGASVTQLVKTHAREKGLSAVSLVRDGVILSADTVVFFDGKIIGKPKDMAAARRTLGRLQGQWHTVYTGVGLLQIEAGHIKKRTVFVEKTGVKIQSMSAAEIVRYFRFVNPLDKAGAYAIQSKSRSIVERVRGSYSNAVGLPMEKLYVKLRPYGQSTALPRRLRKAS